MVNTFWLGRAARCSVPSWFAPEVLALVCVAAPCRCTTPELSLNHAGDREPNPALPDQFSVFTRIGVVPTRERGVAWAMVTAPAGITVVPPSAKPLKATARALSLTVILVRGSCAEDLFQFITGLLVLSSLPVLPNHLRAKPTASSRPP